MNKYPLIGVSIVAVVLLVLGSLTNVVGYQSVQSSGVNESPLFSVRTKRAINQASEDALASNYLGRGIQSYLQFPIQENRTIMLQKVINLIRNMNDKEYKKFQSALVSYVDEDKNNKNIDVNNIVLALKQFRSTTKELNIYLLDKNSDNTDPPTFYECPHRTMNDWMPGCIFLSITILIILGISFFIDVCYRLLTVEGYCV